MGKTRLASGLRLGALVAIALLTIGRAAVASDDKPQAERHAGIEPAGEQLTIHWITPERRPADDLLLTVAPEDADRLDAFFERQGYLMSGVRQGARAVPRVHVTRLPRDLKQLRRAERRKELFLRSVLPLVLMSNEELRSRRGRLLALRERIEAGGTPTSADRRWLVEMAERYGTGPVEPGRAGSEALLDALLLRVDEVPVSLALGQAILESGWGTSRFAVEGNALFGETTPSSKAPHLVKQGTAKRFRAFDSLMESVRAYMHNLNTHQAYRRFREQRAAQRSKGVTPSGRLLLPTLDRYAELPQYLKLVGSLIRSNRLDEFESAQLDRDWFASRDMNF